MIDELPEVDIFVGVDEYRDLVGMIDRLYSKETIDKKELQNRRLITSDKGVGYLRIAEGCDNRCAFCAIPMNRGKYVSQPMEDLLLEAEYLKSNGCEEIIIIAQDTTRYGIDIYGEKKLPKLS